MLSRNTKIQSVHTKQHIHVSCLFFCHLYLMFKKKIGRKKKKKKKKKTSCKRCESTGEKKREQGEKKRKFCQRSLFFKVQHINKSQYCSCRLAYCCVYVCVCVSLSLVIFLSFFLTLFFFGFSFFGTQTPRRRNTIFQPHCVLIKTDVQIDVQPNLRLFQLFRRNHLSNKRPPTKKKNNNNSSEGSEK